MKGVFEEGSYSGPCGDMDELKMFVIAQALWNTSIDDKAVIREFVDHYYGKAAAFVHLYIDLFVDSVAKTQYYMHESFGPSAPFLTPITVITAAQAFRNATQVFVR